MQAAKAVGIPSSRVYILEMPKEFSGNKSVPFKTVGQLIDTGKQLPQLEPLKWEKGQGARQTAYLCYSSGTSGFPVRLLSSSYQLSFPEVMLTELPERCYDQPPECDFQYHADNRIRKTCPRQEARWW